jgi:hypothetical protein
MHKDISVFVSKTCDICNKAVLDVKRHKNLVHFKIKPHPCRYCDKHFGTSYNRNSHERSIHGVELGKKNLSMSRSRGAYNPS